MLVIGDEVHISLIDNQVPREATMVSNLSDYFHFLVSFIYMFLFSLIVASTSPCVSVFPSHFSVLLLVCPMDSLALLILLDTILPIVPV